MICANFDTFLLDITPPKRRPRMRGSGNDGGGRKQRLGRCLEAAGGGWGRLAARGEGSGGWLWFDLSN